MKFSKCLQCISDAINPTWAPYWPNYKLLKKLINEIPMCPTYAASIGKSDAAGRSQRCIRIEGRSIGPVKNPIPTRAVTPIPTSSSSSSSSSSNKSPSSLPQTLLRIPGEVLFFKVLHGELRKATYFFGRVSKEIQYHEELVKAELDELLNLRGITTTIPLSTASHNRQDANDNSDTTDHQTSILINRWNVLAKSIFQLYNTCMCLEIYAIMCYCSFSKILKKHDKVSGFDTREPFILKVVQGANFFQYPELLTTISSMQELYEQVSQEISISIMEEEGQQSHNHRHRRSSIHDEDGQLFIDMIQRLNQQEGRGGTLSSAVDGDASSSRFDYNGSSNGGGGGNESSHQTAAAVVVNNKGLLCQDTFPGQLSTLRCLVEASAISANDCQKKGQGSSSSSSQQDETSAMMISLVDVINQFFSAERSIADQQQQDGTQGIGPPKSATAVIIRTKKTGATTTTTARRKGTTTTPSSSNNSSSPRGRRNKKRNRSTTQQQDRGGGGESTSNNKKSRLSKDDDDITDFVPVANE